MTAGMAPDKGKLRQRGLSAGFGLSASGEGGTDLRREDGRAKTTDRPADSIPRRLLLFRGVLRL
jgi:hypothetical protein